MMEKKRMAALLAAVLFGMSAIPAGAVNLIDTDAAATDSAEHAELDLYGVRATVTDRQDGELTVSTETAGTVVVHIAEQTIIMDTQTGLPAGAQDIKKGDEVYLYCGEMMALSEPPQVYAKAILVNLTDEHEPASLLSAEQVKRNADGSLTVQASNGGLTLNIARNASVTPFGTKNKAKLEDIRMGTRFFAWYDTILESYPAQASTEKIVLLPREDDTFAIVIEGDIAIGEGRMTNGVAMVPLRLTAELCGFTVKWNARDRTVHLTNGTVQTTVTIGQDEYFRATALPDADGMSRPGALGAAPYIAQSRTWVPAELFGLLGEQIEMRGDALNLSPLSRARMLSLRLSANDLLRMYYKYIGVLGGPSSVYRFEAVWHGRTVRTVVKEPVQSVRLECVVHNPILTDGPTWDCAAVSLRAIDQNGNLLPYCGEAVQLSVEGPVKILGPAIVPLRGGMAGTYLATTGEAGRAVLHCRMEGALDVEAALTVRKRSGAENAN